MSRFLVFMGNRLGHFIKDRREALGFSQRALARKAKISHTAINKLEAGETTPTTETIEALSTALGLPLSDLLDQLQGKALKTDQDPILSMLFSEIKQLSPPKRKLIQEMVQLLLRHEKDLI